MRSHFSRTLDTHILSYNSIWTSAYTQSVHCVCCILVFKSAHYAFNGVDCVVQIHIISASIDTLLSCVRACLVARSKVKFSTVVCLHLCSMFIRCACTHIRHIYIVSSFDATMVYCEKRLNVSVAHTEKPSNSHSHTHRIHTRQCDYINFITHI